MNYDDDEKLTEKEAGKWLGYTPLTLYKWRHQKLDKLPYIKVGCHAFYLMKDLKNFVLRGKI